MEAKVGTYIKAEVYTCLGATVGALERTVVRASIGTEVDAAMGNVGTYVGAEVDTLRGAKVGTLVGAEARRSISRS